jgi:hypothetical protein
MSAGMKRKAGLFHWGAIFGLVLLVCAGSAWAYKSAFVGELPEIKDVYLKLFSSFIEQASADQVRLVIEDRFSQDEKIALGDFFGKDGMNVVRARCTPEKLALLDALDKALSGQSTSVKFKDALPGILADSLDVLTVEQVETMYSSLDEKEMGTLPMYMDIDGLSEMFKRIPPEKAEVIMNYTPDWLFLELGKMSLARFNTYESIVYKQERVDGNLQDVETIILKFRHRPWALYMKWIDGPFKGRELLFNEQISNTHVRVRESGFLGLIAVDIPLTSSLARRGSNHVPTEIGIFYLMDMIEKDYRKAAPLGDIKRKNLGIQEVDGHKVFVMDSLLPRDKSKGYYCFRMRHYIDYKRSLEIKAVMYNWDNELAESYTYTKIKINPGYTDQDFQPDNPEYDL